MSLTGVLFLFALISAASPAFILMTAAATQTTIPSLAVLVCPSQFINLLGNHKFSYPIDIYQENRTLIPDEAEYACVSVDFTFPTPHRCSYKYFCPLYEENINTARSLIKWNISSNLCHFVSHQLNRFPNSRKTNVVLLGGSVPFGQGALGCCCLSSFEGERCPKTFHCGDETGLHWNVRDGHRMSFHCRWGAHLEQFLHTTYSHVVFHEIVLGSTGSGAMASKVVAILTERGIQLGRGDIVLFDHSMNDVAPFGRNLDDPPYHLRVGLEELFRNILSYAKEGYPTLILLEMWGRHNYREYSEIYRELAAHYGAYLWSLPQVLHSEFMNTNQSQYVNYLNTVNNQLRNIHPPWHVSMFYADLISNLLFREIASKESCTPADEVATSTTLPPVLAKVKPTIKQCAKDKQVLSSFRFTSGKIESSAPESLLIEPPNSWQLVEDRVGKYGLITEYIDDAHSAQHRITIQLGENIDESIDYLFLFEYMKTYLNAGIVELTICEQYVTILDALWPDYQTYHVSTMHAEPVVINGAWINKLCKRHVGHTMELQYYFWEEKKDPRKRAARTSKQKFKLESIVICPGAME